MRKDPEMLTSEALARSLRLAALGGGARAQGSGR